jgi:hypothetical protein
VSAKVSVSGKLPGGEEWNGLDHYSEDIANDHTLMLGCWVVFDVPTATINYDAGTTVPRLRIRQVEVVTTDGSLPEGEFRRTVEEAFFERTGKTPLPLDEAGGSAVDDEEADRGE